MGPIFVGHAGACAILNPDTWKLRHDIDQTKTSGGQHPRTNGSFEVMDAERRTAPTTTTTTTTTVFFGGG